jgi:hypothetical protein
MSPRRFKRLIVWGTIFCAVVAFTLVLVLGIGVGHEPRCCGMSLSEWLMKSNPQNVGEGIAEIGPDAIPFLARKLKPPVPLWNNLYTRLWKTLPQNVRTRLPWPYQSEQMRKNALFALKEFGDEAKPVLSEVINAARNDPSLFCRTFAMNTAVAIGHDDPAVTSLFKELLKNPASADSAAMAPHNAARFPSNCLPYFLPILRDKQKLPYNALVGISVLGPGAGEAVPLLVEALRNPQLHGNAISAIRRVGPAAEPAVPVLLPLLETLEPMSLAGACEALMNIGPKASSAVPALRRLTTNDDVTIRILAAAAVAKISGAAKDSIPVIADGLRSGQDSKASWTAPVRRFGFDHYSFNHQMAAAWLLGELAPESIDALPILKESLKNAPEWLTPVLARSIWKLEGKPNEVVPILRTGLRSKVHEARVIACTTLAEIGSAARDALPDLQAVCTTNLNTRQAARFAMRRINPDVPLP